MMDETIFGLVAAPKLLPKRHATPAVALYSGMTLMIVLTYIRLMDGQHTQCG